jgi:hypothetical protein
MSSLERNKCRKISRLAQMNYDILFKLKPKLVERTEEQGIALNRTTSLEKSDLFLGNVIDEVNIDNYYGMHLGGNKKMIKGKDPHYSLNRAKERLEEYFKDCVEAKKHEGDPNYKPKKKKYIRVEEEEE